MLFRSLVPTRELATQVAETLAPLAAALGLRTTTIFGGVGMQPQINALAAGVDIEGVLGDQTATATLDYVPGRGRAKAYLRFDADPSRAAVSVKGWSAP